MRVSRRFAGFLLLVAAWDVVTWTTFIRNLARTEGRPTGYYVAHGVLIVVNLAIAAVLAIAGWRGLRARPEDGRGPEGGTEARAGAEDGSAVRRA